MNFLHHMLKQHKNHAIAILGVLILIAIYLSSQSQASFAPGTELDPNCEPGDVGCVVDISTATPGGSSGDVQYNNGGNFGGSDSVDVVDRKLNDSLGDQSVNWETHKLTISDFTPTDTSVDWFNHELHSPGFLGGPVLAVDWGGRQLNDTSGNPVLSWGSGSVGIGTTGPDSKLHIASPTAGFYAFHVAGDPVSAAQVRFDGAAYGLSIDTNNANSGKYALNVTSNSGANTLLYLRNDGFIGAGLASPIRSLSIGNGNGFATANNTNSVFVGIGVAPSLTTGVDNVGVGTLALSGLTTAGQSVAVGHNALSTMTTGGIGGGDNVAVGISALASSNAYQGVAIGSNAGQFTTGERNTVVGWHALFGSGASSYNTAMGWNSMGSITSGSDNVGIGQSSLLGLTTGNYNVALGSGTLQASTTNDANTAVGYNALNDNTSIRNTAIGYRALADNTAGNYNTAVGYNSMGNSTLAYENTAVGFNTLSAITSGFYNTALGNEALSADTGGSYNTALGFKAMTSNLGGSANTAVGTNALLANTSGGDNTAVGFNALSTNTTGVGNVALGRIALATNNGDFNIGIGVEALNSTTTGSYNVASGYRALSLNTTGANNLALGYDALYNNVSGNNNNALGRGSLFSNSIGGSNVAIGLEAGYSSTGDGNIFIGYQSGKTNGTGSDELWIDNADNVTPLIFGDFSLNRVGIGTTSPISELDVSGGIVNAAGFSRNGAGGVTSNLTGGTCTLEFEGGILTGFSGTC